MNFFKKTTRDLKWNYVRIQMEAFFRYRAKKSSLHGPYFLRITYLDSDNPKIACHLERNELILSFDKANNQMPIGSVYFTVGKNTEMALPEKKFHSSIELFSKGDIDKFINQLPSIWAIRKD